VRLAGDRVHRRVDGGGALAAAQGAAVDGEDDVGGIARGGGEAVLQQVERRLGLGPRRTEVVGEGAAGAGGQRADRDEHGDDEREGAPPVGRGSRGETSEEMGHGRGEKHTSRKFAINADMQQML
jgi:hypothetical protein